MEILVRPIEPGDIQSAVNIWNEVVLEGNAFPQTETLDEKSGAKFFSSQTKTAVAVLEGEVVGLYILHPNNIGRCGHIANASYAVKSSLRGKKIGESLVSDCLSSAKAFGFKILQFNAVVKKNLAANALYEKLGFVKLGEIPGGFYSKNNIYEDIVLYYHLL